MDAKDCQDLNYSLYKPEASHQLCSTLNMGFSAYTFASHYSNNIYYCQMVDNSADLFGCIALNHKQYCVLNRQYTKDEYERLVPQIIESMKKDTTYGEFFPIEESICGYNETVAHEYMPLTKEEVLKRGWHWRDEQASTEDRGPGTEPPDAIDQVPDDIVGKVLICQGSGKPFKIIPQELKFYREQHIPVPHRSPDQRHRDRLALRNPRKLWDRNCFNCKKPIRTSYSPERPEKVYCEECYLKAVY